MEITAALVARAAAERRAFALVAGHAVLEPGHGTAHMERALDILARVDFHPGATAPAPPVPPSACVLVTVRQTGRSAAAEWGDLFVVGSDARLVAAPAAA